jgi:predicted ribosomally synthesized peptide with nif11-like leader
MAGSAAQAAIDRMEADEEFAQRLKDASDPDACLELLHAEGFDVTAGDMRDALLDRYGDELTPEQLDAIAGGVEPEEVVAVAVVVAWGVGVAGFAAAAAAV